MITVVATEISPRLTYVVEEINRRSQLGWKLSETSTSEVQLLYGKSHSSEFYNIKEGENKLLYDSKNPQHASKFVNGRVFLDNAFLDTFETIFWALSRYEEYDFQTTDEHGRFGIENTSISVEIARKPWVDQIIQRLEEDVLQFYQIRTEKKKPEVSVIPTFDIDHAYAFRYKSWWVKLGGFFKDYLKKDEERYRYRWSTLVGKGKDPYDTHDEVGAIVEQYSGYVFMHLGDRGPYDKSISWKKKPLQNIIKKYDALGKVGIHPSYRSNEKRGALSKEVSRLEKIIGQKVQYSRQHFLKIQFPKTPKMLLEQKVKEDHTMAFFDAPGFRAGTAYPFAYFDFDKNEKTVLDFYPVVYMDGTFCEYLKLSIEQSKEIVDELFENMAPTGGHFECIWHNETIANFGKWKGWKSLLEHTLNQS